MDNSSLIDKLEKALALAEGSESNRPHKPIPFDSFYKDSYRAYCDVTRSQYEAYCSYLFDCICDALKSKLSDEPLAICSLGCGDGDADYKILSKVAESHPDADVLYYGVDINALSCSVASKRMKALPYQTNIVNESFLDVIPQRLPKFDLFFLAHVHYRFSADVRPLVSKAMSLCKPQQGRVEMITFIDAPLWKIYRTFGSTVFYAKPLLTQLRMLELQYCTYHLPGEADFSKCVEDDFAFDYSFYAIAFICQKNLRNYPSEVAKLSIDYIKSCLDANHCCDCSSMAISIPWTEDNQAELE